MCAPSNHFFHTLTNLTERVTDSVEGEAFVVIVIEAKAGVREVTGGVHDDDILVILDIVTRMITKIYNYLAKTSERDGSKKVDVELKIAWGRITFHQSQSLINGVNEFH